MKSKILCATDFSPAADDAARAALALASRLRADLELVHVTGPTSERLNTLQDLGLLKSLSEIGERRMDFRIKNLQHPSVRVTRRVIEARGKTNVAATLKTLVAELQPQMVVIGTHGKGDAGFWPMGSFAETLAESLDAPVMVIHSAQGITKWGANESNLRVFAGVELSKDALPVLSILRAFRTAGDCELTACHVNHVPPPVDSMLGALDVSPASLRSLVGEEKKLRQLIRGHVGSKVQSDVEIAVLSTGTHLVDLAHTSKADLLIVGTHHRGHLARLFFGSVSRQVLRHSAVNVLCVPVTKRTPPGFRQRQPQSTTSRSLLEPVLMR
jgi:nucleotide-binding universal stress UspA family protein